MNAPLTIRPATPADEAAVFTLASQLSTAFVLDCAAFSASFVRMLGEPGLYLHVVEESAAGVTAYLLGWARPSFYANGPVAWVQEIVVQPAQRRSGLGRQLMAHFEAWATGQGCQVVSLASRGARDFYQALGYSASEATYFKKKLGHSA